MPVDSKVRGVVDVLEFRGVMHAGEDVARLAERLQKLADAGRLLVVLDLGAVTSIDSVCLGALVVWGERLRKRGGVLKLVLGARLRAVFAGARLDGVFECFPNQEAALDAFAAATETAGIP